MVGEKNRDKQNLQKNTRLQKQIVVPSENGVFEISKELGLKSDSQFFLWWFASV